MNSQQMRCGRWGKAAPVAALEGVDLSRDGSRCACFWRARESPHEWHECIHARDISNRMAAPSNSQEHACASPHTARRIDSVCLPTLPSPQAALRRLRTSPAPRASCAAHLGVTSRPSVHANVYGYHRWDAAILHGSILFTRARWCPRGRGVLMEGIKKGVPTARRRKGALTARREGGELKGKRRACAIGEGRTLRPSPKTATARSPPSSSARPPASSSIQSSASSSVQSPASFSLHCLSLSRPRWRARAWRRARPSWHRSSRGRGGCC